VSVGEGKEAREEIKRRGGGGKTKEKGGVLEWQGFLVERKKSNESKG